eukprot:CAMPEP_0175075408 /NCGR_PEP_ID=MMETSP0052_2-20121109/21981_1 /TAXON_ID=51329 ORGANISM="Polytomella parva, Strain SAG 63-3" /NCGR_SAMPLE_ID=MMETSP0052_2 /ASSEMBLY_ACC=CAM_ASM_000194 /LENGTH=157 /DNA_ID=CAMNT_0016344085 /DNA_START=434 /DNA_END=907 /DNA_ORIENTATION=+
MYNKWESNIKAITPAFLLSDIACRGNEGVDLVVLYSDYHINCRTMASVFSDLAERYSGEKIRFYRLDMGEYSALAKMKDIDIDVSPMSSQMPTIILYVDGEEHGRLPLKKGGKIHKKDFTSFDVINAFELDMRFTTGRDAKPKVISKENKASTASNK